MGRIPRWLRLAVARGMNKGNFLLALLASLLVARPRQPENCRRSVEYLKPDTGKPLPACQWLEILGRPWGLRRSESDSQALGGATHNMSQKKEFFRLALGQGNPLCPLRSIDGQPGASCGNRSVEEGESLKSIQRERESSGREERWTREAPVADYRSQDVNQHAMNLTLGSCAKRLGAKNRLKGCAN
jgi:hypothetical protein